MKKRRKTIIAGSLVKVIEYTPPVGKISPQKRGARCKATTAAQRKLNHKTAQGRLENKLAANFSASDYFCTFTYAPGEEPQTRKEVNIHKQKYIRDLRTMRKKRGQDLKWVFSIENKTGAGRYHLHAVINAADLKRDIEEIKSLWPHGHVEVTRLFDDCHKYNSWLDVARYMTKERPEYGHDDTPNGAQVYSCSRNLEPPIIITEWVEERERIEIPITAIVIEREDAENEYSRYSYCKYMTRPLFMRN